MLRRRRRADVAGGIDRQADQRRAGRAGAAAGAADDRDGLPVLRGDDGRRHLGAGQGRTRSPTRDIAELVAQAMARQ